MSHVTATHLCCQADASRVLVIQQQPLGTVALPIARMRWAPNMGGVRKLGAKKSKQHGALGLQQTLVSLEPKVSFLTLQPARHPSAIPIWNVAYKNTAQVSKPLTAAHTVS